MSQLGHEGRIYRVRRRSAYRPIADMLTPTGNCRHLHLKARHASVSVIANEQRCDNRHSAVTDAGAISKTRGQAVIARERLSAMKLIIAIALVLTFATAAAAVVTTPPNHNSVVACIGVC